VHLEIDTGMSRGGCRPDAAPELVRRINESRWLRLVGVATHFAKAKTDARFTARQLAAFDRALTRCAKLLPDDCIVHVANTCATIRARRYHKRMVRFGQAWAGLGAESLPDGPLRRLAAGLKPIVTWRSELVQVKTIEAGTPVGYGARWTASRKTRLGLVPVGYADGYPTGLAATDQDDRPPCAGIEHGGAWHFGRVIGHVNMDQIVIDITGAPPDVGVGATVELIGTDPEAPNHLVALARTAGTVPHELLCRLSPRVPRIYHATERYDGASVAEAAARP